MAKKIFLIILLPVLAAFTALLGIAAVTSISTYRIDHYYHENFKNEYTLAGSVTGTNRDNKVVTLPAGTKVSFMMIHDTGKLTGIRYIDDNGEFDYLEASLNPDQLSEKDEICRSIEDFKHQQQTRKNGGYVLTAVTCLFFFGLSSIAVIIWIRLLREK
ncbi:MAG: hypothetical protein J6X33_00805 [Clostridiales bacterium]|nr:hypothetical protein [Clostridiales bacterium]